MEEFIRSHVSGHLICTSLFISPGATREHGRPSCAAAMSADRLWTDQYAQDVANEGAQTRRLQEGMVSNP